MATNRKSVWETENLVTLPRYRSKPEFLNLGAIDIWVVGSRAVDFRMFKQQSCIYPLAFRRKRERNHVMSPAAKDEMTVEIVPVV